MNNKFLDLDESFPNIYHQETLEVVRNSMNNEINELSNNLP